MNKEINIEQAINCIDDILDCDIHIDETLECELSTFDFEWLELSKKALEKQIPKKPCFEGDGYADGKLVYDTWICPCCGKDYEVDYGKHKHCPECGQKLDWEVKE